MSELWNYDADVDVPGLEPDGFDVVAQDKVVGTVVSGVRDADVSFLVVKTGGLLHKRQVVVPAGLVEQFSPSAERVFLRADPSFVEIAPEFDEHWRADPTWRERATGHFTG